MVRTSGIVVITCAKFAYVYGTISLAIFAQSSPRLKVVKLLSSDILSCHDQVATKLFAEEKATQYV